MKSIFNRAELAAAVLSLVTLAGCNAVEDVREEPTILEPPPTVVLQGTVTGLGSRRGLLLTNNGQDSDAVTIIAPIPTQVSTAAQPVAFTFGSRAIVNTSGNPVPYNVQIKQVPYGKRCAFRAGSRNSGTLSLESPPQILIDCTPDPAVALYDLRVYLDPAFTSATGAKVQLRTEEAIFEKSPTSADITAGFLTFEDLLFNSSSNALNGPLASPAAPPGSPVFEYNVTATTSVGGTLNRCPVTNPSNAINVTGTAPNQVSSLQNPSGNITASSGPAGTNVAPRVGACSFTISGAVHYSRPAGVTADPALGSGLVLELRDLNGVRVGTASVAAGAFPASPPAGQTTGIGFTFNNTSTPATTAFTSNPNADFQVVVSTQPAGQTCILQDGGYVSLKSLINLNPVAITATGTMSNGSPAPTNVTPLAGNPAAGNVPIAGTRLAVYCRTRPALADQLHGVYRLTSTVASFVTSTGATAPACQPVTLPSCTITSSSLTSRWVPFDLSVQNTASSNLLTFFDDGTFLYGTHMQSAQVEHGFYDYSATLRADNGTPAAGAPAAAPGRLRLTVHTDTFPNTVFPTPPTFNVANVATTGPQTTTPGISALPGPLFYGTAPAIAATAPGTAPVPLASRHLNLGNVVKIAASGSTPARITATAGPFGGVAATVSTPTFTFLGVPPAPAPTGTATTPTTTSVARQVDWELTEVPQANGEMTGGWVSQDYRRFWVWDKATDYGFAVGVNGLVNLQSSCFVTENAVAPSGTYQRRSGQTLCYPINRPAENQVPAFGGILDTLLARDNAWMGVTHLFATTGAAPGAAAGLLPIASNGNVVNGQYSTAELTNRFPNYESRIPGGFSVLDGRSPSPIIYHVGTSAGFFTGAPAQYFPQPATPFTTWCPDSDILGIRSTLNGLPFREPVYLCRTRAR
jgi:hypothetical protein